MGWMSVLPPLVAILVVFWRKEVIVALLLAIVTSELLHTWQGGEPLIYTFVATIERIIAVFGSASNTRILVFSLLCVALLAYISVSLAALQLLLKHCCRVGLVKPNAAPA